MDTSPSELILLDGTVSSVIYRNEENGYTILRLEAPEARYSSRAFSPTGIRLSTISARNCSP